MQNVICSGAIIIKVLEFLTEYRMSIAFIIYKNLCIYIRDLFSISCCCIFISFEIDTTYDK